MSNRLFYCVCALVTLQASPSLAASPDFRDAVRTYSGRVVVNSFDHCVRTQGLADKDACGPAPRAAAARAEIAQEERTVYFDFNKYALSPEAVQKLDSLAAKLTADTQVTQARIVGYADRIGTPSYNEALSKRRAINVQRYLVSRGVINSRIADTRWLGESSPVTQCGTNLSRSELIQCLRKDRRVEVEIDYRK